MPYSYGAFTPELDNDKTNVELVHSYYAFYTRSDKPGVKGIIGMHRFNICLVVVLLWCETTITDVAKDLCAVPDKAGCTKAVSPSHGHWVESQDGKLQVQG